MTLIVGLGNPTDKYKHNRHNIGFMVIDKLVNDRNASNITKAPFKGVLFKSNNLLFLKPMTYMNLSGESVGAVDAYYKPDQIIVIHDELDVEFGKIRFKNGGSHGGHNGLKSIDAHVGADYDRLRLGIGRPAFKGEVTKHVLSDFSKEEKPCLENIIDKASEIVLDLAGSDIKSIQQQHASKQSYCI
ncbi:MAG: aminoacyl-tRNA hydrolase [Epsilonproteobacteria bacterium]|nr:aminoacyl-tRNA hydrolase [Campylobacterota bacterium]